MRIFRSNFYSLFIIGAAFSISGNAQSSHIRCGDIDLNASTVGNYFKSADTSQTYVELNDGRKFYGNNLAITSGNDSKATIKIGDTICRVKDTRGYFAGGVYYGRTRNTYAKRFIVGKLSIFRADFSSSLDITNFRGKTRTYDRPFCNYYGQKGDSPELILLMTFQDLEEVVKDCPKSLAMIDKKIKEIWKALDENPNYLNEIISIYNKGCE